MTYIVAAGVLVVIVATLIVTWNAYRTFGNEDQ